MRRSSEFTKRPAYCQCDQSLAAAKFSSPRFESKAGCSLQTASAPNQTTCGGSEFRERVERLVDILKIVLTQTTFRFSVEHRLPKALSSSASTFCQSVERRQCASDLLILWSQGLNLDSEVQHWTPFDIYLISCQLLACLIAGRSKRD